MASSVASNRQWPWFADYVSGIRIIPRVITGVATSRLPAPIAKPPDVGDATAWQPPIALLHVRSINNTFTAETLQSWLSIQGRVQLRLIKALHRVRIARCTILYSVHAV
jgi:hypothetical protein